MMNFFLKKYFILLIFPLTIKAIPFNFNCEKIYDVPDFPTKIVNFNSLFCF